jgi:hypothetical protein
MFILSPLTKPITVSAAERAISTARLVGAARLTSKGIPLRTHFMTISEESLPLASIMFPLKGMLSRIQ